MSTTTRIRIGFAVLLAAAVIVCLVGWMGGRDPRELGELLQWLTMAAAVGEASNIGKRATWKREAADHDNHYGAVGEDARRGGG